MVKPYESDKTKKEEVALMFNNIAHKYDFLNHFFSLGIDFLWRKKAIRLLKKNSPKSVLDLATGTADFAIAARKLKPNRIVGADISKGMVDIGKIKVKKKNLQDLITLEIGDSENLRFEDNEFDALTVGFGVRNYGDLKKGLGEMLRVVKPGGNLAILEFSKPTKFPVKQAFSFYFKYIMPVLGNWLAKDQAAYTYLPESVQAFPSGQDFVDILSEVGYKNVKVYPLSGGIASIYFGEK
jgi:demethylmenaquinone methyltransferase/2-methoxy-6-polyprenyl-1,4-benzoquinol methylase